MPIFREPPRALLLELGEVEIGRDGHAQQAASRYGDYLGDSPDVTLVLETIPINFSELHLLTYRDIPIY
jgi:hypothetical protein